MPIMVDNLGAAGWSKPNFKVGRRVVMALDGEEKVGKTSFALRSDREPIFLFNFNMGLEGILRNFRDKDMVVCDLPRGGWIAQEAGGEKEQLSEARNAMVKFYKAYRYALKSKGTIILDTASEFRELLRLARLGKLDQVQARYYGPVNAEERAVLQMAKDQPELSFIAIHQLKDEYKNDKRTGGRVRHGAGDIGYLSDCTVVLSRKSSGGVLEFTGNITECRYDTGLIGMELMGDMCGFNYLLEMIHG
jgi:hypothetical protein